MRHTYRNRRRACGTCPWTGKLWSWSNAPAPACPDCGAATDEDVEILGVAPGVAADDIPGGLEVKHAICHPDGTPRKFYSKSEIRKAARAAGWTISGETPKDPGATWF
jgi:hypothetical protein